MSAEEISQNAETAISPDFSADSLPLYRIEDGVRRTVAVYRCGRKSILAFTLNSLGRQEPAFEVLITQLGSDKKVIETAGVQFSRWRRILRAAEAGHEMSPIQVTTHVFGVPVSEITVEGEDELEGLSF